MTSELEQAYKRMRFEMCPCRDDELRHGYFTKAGERFPAMIVSFRAGEETINAFFEGRVVTAEERKILLTDLRAAKLRYRVDGDFAIASDSLTVKVELAEMIEAILGLEHDGGGFEVRFGDDYDEEDFLLGVS